MTGRKLPTEMGPNHQELEGFLDWNMQEVLSLKEAEQLQHFKMLQ